MSMRACLVNISLILTHEIVHFHSPMADNRTKEIFEALMARDAVLLNEILENINRSERASGLSADQSLAPVNFRLASLRL